MMKDWKIWCQELGNYPGEGGIQKIQADARNSAWNEAIEKATTVLAVAGYSTDTLDLIRDLKVPPAPKPCEHIAYTIHRGVGGQEKQQCVNCPMYRYVRMVPDCEWRKEEAI